MSQVAAVTDVEAELSRLPPLSGETRERIGTALRLVYEKSVDADPIPDTQIDLLLQLRHRERDLRRAG